MALAVLESLKATLKPLAQKRTRTSEETIEFNATLKAVMENLHKVSDRSAARLLGVSRSAVKKARLQPRKTIGERKIRKDCIEALAAPFLTAWWHDEGSRLNTDSSHYIRVNKKEDKHQPRYQMDSVKHLWHKFKVAQ
jgi:hypothetical protein